ncbi:peptidase S8/S53 domain-containing protein [Lactarius pseudohatsudake]|nr:peptidase S8/S53 domain-containing protein [Lactarius pseudohatsudake]
MVAHASAWRETSQGWLPGSITRLFRIAKACSSTFQVSDTQNFLPRLTDTGYSPNGRTYPDIVAQAQNFQVVVGGSTISVAGTSCSAPNTELTALCQTVAGVFSLLNDFLISQGKALLRFLNPLIYTSASAFNDIKSGSNPGCGTQGFSAVTGWDPFGHPEEVGPVQCI